MKKIIREYAGTVLMFLSGGLLPFSIYLIGPALIVFALCSIFHFKNLRVNIYGKIFLFLVASTAIPYFITRVQFNNNISGRSIYIIPDDYEGLFGIIFDHPDGVDEEFFTTNRKYVIPDNGILLSKTKGVSSGLRYTGETVFVTAQQYRRGHHNLLFNHYVTDTLQLSDIICDQEVKIVNDLRYKRVEIKGTEYLGYFFQIGTTTDQIVPWKDITGGLVDSMLSR